MTLESVEIAKRLNEVRARIQRACEQVSRDSSEVTLVAVSKRHSLQSIRAAYDAGQREFGENYAQELVQKAEALRHLVGIRWRMIGHVQRNKVKALLRIGAAIDTIDSLRLARALSRHSEGLRMPVEVGIQVNLSAEPQKAGVSPAELPELVAAVRELPHLNLCGLMTIPRTESEAAAAAFAELRTLADRYGLPKRSMGMSSDLEAAIANGATHVRVGTAIFGPRP